jgi:hypothetical protein
MDKHRSELVVILAGYKSDMERNILQANDGFRRRIQWFFHLDDYSPEELYHIFKQKLVGFQFENTLINEHWFRTNYKKFPFMGGSVENFVQKIRHVQTSLMFGQSQKSLITNQTLQQGFKMYLEFVYDPMQSERAKVEAEKKLVGSPLFGFHPMLRPPTMQL